MPCANMTGCSTHEIPDRDDTGDRIRNAGRDRAIGRHRACHPLPDERYRIQREYCGYSEPRHVVRFCDLWLGQSTSRARALAIARSHDAVQQARLALARAEAHLALTLAGGR